MKKIKFIELIENFSNFLIEKGYTPTGCNDYEISVLEKRYGDLPELYKIFLHYIGKSAGDFKKGTWCFYSELEDINIETIELMKSNHVSIPENMFAFLMHQGYTSLFFTDRSNEDPLVYCYTECEEVDNLNKTFSQALIDDINDYLSNC